MLLSCPALRIKWSIYHFRCRWCASPSKKTLAGADGTRYSVCQNRAIMMFLMVFCSPLEGASDPFHCTRQWWSVLIIM